LKQADQLNSCKRTDFILFTDDDAQIGNLFSLNNSHFTNGWKWSKEGGWMLLMMHILSGQSTATHVDRLEYP